MRLVEDSVPIPRFSGLRFVNEVDFNKDKNHNKLTIDEWNRFSGWCGHQHVPANDHPCPGALA